MSTMAITVSGKDCAGRMSIGQTTVGQMSVGQMSVGKMTVGKMTVGKMTVGKMTVGKMTVGKMTVGKMTVGKMTFGQMTFGQMIFGQTTFGQMMIGQMTVDTNDIWTNDIWTSSIQTNDSWPNGRAIVVSTNHCVSKMPVVQMLFNQKTLDLTMPFFLSLTLSNIQHFANFKYSLAHQKYFALKNQIKLIIKNKKKTQLKVKINPAVNEIKLFFCAASNIPA
jgi:hypothetical protein